MTSASMTSASMTQDAFSSLSAQGFCRVAAVRPQLILGAPDKNAAFIAKLLQQCDQEQVAVAVFPELCLTGYTLEDLFLNPVILEETLSALQKLIEISQDLNIIGIVGLPLQYHQTLYNCAAVFHKGRLLGLIPKSHILSEGEFYEARHFASGKNLREQKIDLWGESYPFGTDILFQAQDFPDLCFGVEICQDLWVPSTPGMKQVEAGALIIANLSASPALAGRPKDRSDLCASYSKRLMAGYVYAASGWGESTNDLVWDGQLMVYEAGQALGNISSPLPDAQNLLIRDIDLKLLRAKRLKSNYFRTLCAEETSDKFRFVRFNLSPVPTATLLMREVPAMPFHFPKESCAENIREVLEFQAVALAQRLKISKAETMIIGVSGGLDSALALLVCDQAAKILKWPSEKISACGLPGYGTSQTSEKLGKKLAESLDISLQEIDIRPICQSLFQALGHPAKDLSLTGNLVKSSHAEKIFDLTFENVQAGVRTDFLFRLAGQKNGLVVGTGDLSELALGWCTYGVGDQMAHYNVNAGLPKTLIQQIIHHLAETETERNYSAALKEVLKEIAERPISPELLPSDEKAQIQETEATTGPYILQDFILWHVLKYGASPRRIAFLLQKAWGKTYSSAEILECLEIFAKRFFNFSQFKRSAMPNGPKILSDIGLSPRGDWRAPSDLEAQIWQKEILQLKEIL